MGSFDNLSDTELTVRVDGLRLSLIRAWSRREAGSLSNLYDLARACAEAQVRGVTLAPLGDPDQLALFSTRGYELRPPDARRG